MSIKMKNVMIRRDAALIIPQNVPVWEVPLLEAAHENVTVEGESTFEREAPDAQDEYRRLETKYGRSENEDGSRGQPFVAAVYGHMNGGGVKRLAEAIQAATVVSDDASDLVGAQVA